MRGEAERAKATAKRSPPLRWPPVYCNEQSGFLPLLLVLGHPSPILWGDWGFSHANHLEVRCSSERVTGDTRAGRCQPGPRHRGECHGSGKVEDQGVNRTEVSIY